MLRIGTFGCWITQQFSTSLEAGFREYPFALEALLVPLITQKSSDNIHSFVQTASFSSSSKQLHSQTHGLQWDTSVWPNGDMWCSVRFLVLSFKVIWKLKYGWQMGLGSLCYEFLSLCLTHSHHSSSLTGAESIFWHINKEKMLLNSKWTPSLLKFTGISQRTDIHFTTDKYVSIQYISDQ